jgi:hypothetical protein
MDLATYKKLKEETREAIQAFKESSFLELEELEREAKRVEDEFIAELEGIKTNDLLKKIESIKTSE